MEKTNKDIGTILTFALAPYIECKREITRELIIQKLDEWDELMRSWCVDAGDNSIEHGDK